MNAGIDRNTYASLDGIRALSFLIVFISHIPGVKFPGGLGVTVFFFLSGFLITSLMLREIEQTGALSLRHFYLRRAVRLLPPLLVYLVVAIGIASLTDDLGDTSPYSVLSQLFFSFNYYAIFLGTENILPGSEILWSLAVEEHFYLLYPPAIILLLGLTRRSMAIILLIALCVLAVAWRLYLAQEYYPDESPNRIIWSSDTRFDSLLWGCILGLAYERCRTARLLWSDLACYASLLLFSVIIAASAMSSNALFRESLRYSVQGACLIPLFLIAITRPDLHVLRPLNHPLLMHLGVLSYFLYLVHYSVIHLVYHSFEPLPALAKVGMSILISLLIAEAVFRLVEKPLRHLRSRLRNVAT